MIVTKIYDLNIDNSNIKRVVQWLVSTFMIKLYQRMSRAMRCENEQIYFVWLYFVWCVEERETTLFENFENEIVIAVKMNTLTVKKKKTDRRRRMKIGLWNLINSNANECIRKIGLQYFDDEYHKRVDWQKSFRCCCHCHVENQLFIDIHENINNQFSKKKNFRQSWYLIKLNEWKNKKIKFFF